MKHFSYQYLSCDPIICHNSNKQNLDKVIFDYFIINFDILVSAFIYSSFRDTRNLGAQDLALGCQMAALVASEPDPLTFQLFTEEAIFLCQVGDDVLLLPVHPTGQCRDDDLLCVKDHGWHSTVSHHSRAERT